MTSTSSCPRRVSPNGDIQGVRLEVGQAAEVEIAMQLSAVQEQITVAGDAGTVDVLDSGVGP